MKIYLEDFDTGFIYTKEAESLNDAYGLFMNDRNQNEVSLCDYLYRTTGRVEHNNNFVGFIKYDGEIMFDEEYDTNSKKATATAL